MATQEETYNALTDAIVYVAKEATDARYSSSGVAEYAKAAKDLAEALAYFTAPAQPHG